MKLTELIVCTAIFLLAAVVFTESFINVRRGINKGEILSKNASAVLQNDRMLREEIREKEISYWKNFEGEFENIREALSDFSSEKNIEVKSIDSVYDEKHRAEGIKIEWIYDGREYTTQEFIKQRIVDEKE